MSPSTLDLKWFSRLRYGNRFTHPLPICLLNSTLEFEIGEFSRTIKLPHISVVVPCATSRPTWFDVTR